MVDVINLENGRTIRVIVAAGLDSPGLLAMLSRNAATAIGVPTRGLGRIRMTQSSDPVAFSRFAEGLSGDPNSPDPVAEAVVSSTVRTATAGDLAASTPEDRFYSTVINSPESYVPPAVEYPLDGSVHMEPQPAQPQPAPKATAAPPAFPSPDTSPNSSPYAWQTSPPYIAPPAEASALPPDSVITLEPAGERPPQSLATTAQEGELPPVPQPPRQAKAAGNDIYLDPRYFIGPIPQPVRPLQSPARIINPPLAVSQTVTMPQRTIPQPPAPSPQAAPGGSIFSVPIIKELEGGKRYVQIGAFTRTDTLETAIARANKSYPLAIQADGSNNTVYRLLIGPLNAGESAATLQRLKSNGFPDAFVRSR
jgi:hypothetical protein